MLELGAGAAALPSLVAARACGAAHVTASDTVGPVVTLLERSISANAPSAEARSLDWKVAGRRTYSHEEQYDVVLFSDGVYSERGGLFLADAISSLVSNSL